MKQWNALAVVFLFLSLPLSAQQEYEKEVFISSKGDSLPYRMICPEGMKPGKKYPLVLFLHGAGERGNDNERQLTHGAQMFLNPVNRETYPAFVFIPQCPAGNDWTYKGRRSGTTSGRENPVHQSLKQLLDSYLDMDEVDKDRVYIMGLSMGGMGTFDFVTRYPELFAAAIPICGRTDNARLQAAKEVKFRIFHGDADPTVPVEGSRSAYKALKAVGADVEYIEFPGCRHDSWTPAFNIPDFMKWLFEQKRE